MPFLVALARVAGGVAKVAGKAASRVGKSLAKTATRYEKRGKSLAGSAERLSKIGNGEEYQNLGVRDTFKQLWKERKYIAEDVHNIQSLGNDLASKKDLKTREEKAAKKEIRLETRRFKANIKSSLSMQGEGTDTEIMEYAKSRVFMRATQQWWEGRKADRRLENIRAGIAREAGVKPSEINMQQVYDQIISENADAVREVYEEIRGASVNTNSDDFQNAVRNEDRDEITSLLGLARVKRYHYHL